MDGLSSDAASSGAGVSTGGGSSSAGTSSSSSSSSSVSSSNSSGSSSSTSSRGGGGADSGSSAGNDFSRSVSDVRGGLDTGDSGSGDDDSDTSSTSTRSSSAAQSSSAPPADDHDNRSTASSSVQMNEEANDSLDTSSLSRNTPADPGLTPGQSTALADGAAVMNGYAFSPTDVTPPANDDVTGEEGFVDRAADAVVGTGQMVGGVVVGAAETAGGAVVDTAEMAWEGVKAVNDYAGALMDLGVGWTGIGVFEGHSQRHAERSQAVVDAVKSLPEMPGQIASSASQGWETFEDNWETGNYYEAGKQIGGVGLEVASIAVPAAKAGSLGKISAVDDAAAAGAVARTADDIPETVFRGDTRPPGEVFGPGFEPRGTATDLQDYAENNTPSDFVSTSVAREEAETFATQFGTTDGYVYAIDAKKTGGIDVNATLGADSPYPNEREIAIPGGVPGDAIKGATPISRNGEYGGASFLNPDYYSGPR